MVLFRKLQKATQFSSSDWLYFFQAWIWLFLFDIGLRTRSFSGLKNFASQLDFHSTRTPEQTESLLRKLAVIVDHARYNHLYPMTCLRRSLTLQKMLARQGIFTELKIGARKDDGQLSAHAWLEYQGEIIGEKEEIRGKFRALKKGT